MAAEDQGPGLDLAQLVERLRLAGFRIDTRQYLAAHELLLAYAASGVRLEDDIPRLARTLGPIFCTSPDEQERFAREVLAWQGEPEPSPPPLPPPSPTARPFGTWRWTRWWIPVALGVLTVGIVSTLLYVRYYVPLTVIGKVVVHQRNGDVVTPAQAEAPVEFFVDRQPTTLAADGSFSISVTRARAVTVEARLKGYQPVVQELTAATAASAVLTLVPPVERPATASTASPDATPDAVGVAFSGQSVEGGVQRPLVAAASAGTAFVAFLVLWLAQRARHRLALRQLPVHGDPEAVTLSVPEVPVLPAGESDMNRVALSLRRPREGAILDLDIPDTVDLTVRNAGFFEPRYSARRAMPEYVVLVSRRGAADHQARLFDAAIAHLGERDVTVDSYSFLDDPRTCTSDKTGQAFGLRDVLERHHRATLIVAAETIAAFNRRTGRPSAWVEVTQSHERRVYLTPEAPDRWTELEATLEEAGFVVLPANETGWRVLGVVDGPPPSDLLFPAPYTRPFPAVIGSDELRWLDRNAPDGDVIEKLLRQLKGFLGRDGLAWMSACAVYPEITWALTLRLRGSEPPAPVLPSLSRLPWFRHGFMPEWLRRSLIVQMAGTDEQRVRTELERLLEELATARGTARSGSALHIGRWIGPIDLMRAAAPGSPLRDRVFLGFMTGARDALWLEVPKALGSLFKRRPAALPEAAGTGDDAQRSWRRWLARLRFWSALNPVASRLAASAVIALVAIYPLTKLLAIERVEGAPEAMWFIEVPEATGVLGVGESASVGPFFISRTEVTVGQYRACVADGRCTGSRGPISAGHPDDWPVTDVTWDEAMQFCAWLDTKLRSITGAAGPVFDALTGRRDGSPWQVSLPSAGEWQRAATGSTARRYPWGDDIDELRANFSADGAPGHERPTAVGAYPRGMSALGLMDMGGNVSEWARTGMASVANAVYSVDMLRNPVAPGNPFMPTVLGGSFRSNAAALEVTARERVRRDLADPSLGFRLVITSPAAPASPAAAQQQASQTPDAGAAAPVNRPPTIAGLEATPAGAVLAGTTVTFAATGLTDPEGDTLTYRWSLVGSKDPMTSRVGTAVHVFDRPGPYNVRLTVTDPAGLSASAVIGVTVGTLDGVWDINCEGKPNYVSPTFPDSFVVTIRQNGQQVTGTIVSGDGRKQNFPAPAQLTNTIKPPRGVSFGVESAYNVWDDSDFYFSVELDERLRTMTGTSQYCKKVTGVRRAPAAAR